AEWFMDSRGPDGSPLDVDGDDLRVLVALLQHAGVLDLPDRAETAVATRSGVFTVRREGQEYAVDMGPWTFPGGDDALADGFDLSVIAEGLTEQRPGLRVNLRGEHVVVALQDEETLAGLSMTGPAQVDPPLEGAAMLEFVLPLGEQEGAETDAAGAPVRTGVIRMRARSGPAGRRRSGRAGMVRRRRPTDLAGAHPRRPPPGADERRAHRIGRPGAAHRDLHRAALAAGLLPARPTCPMRSHGAPVGRGTPSNWRSA